MEQNNLKWSLRTRLKTSFHSASCVHPLKEFICGLVWGFYSLYETMLCPNHVYILLCVFVWGVRVWCGYLGSVEDVHRNCHGPCSSAGKNEKTVAVVFLSINHSQRWIQGHDKCLFVLFRAELCTLQPCSFYHIIYKAKRTRAKSTRGFELL